MAKMSNSYIDGLISPSRNKRVARTVRPKASLEIGEDQATKQHLEQQRLLRAERLRKEKLRNRNISLAQSDDPLVGQAEIRRKQSVGSGNTRTISEISAMPEMDAFNNKATSAKPELTETSKSATVTSRIRRKIGDFSKRNHDDFVEPVQAFGLTRQDDFDEDFDNKNELGDARFDDENLMDLSSDELFNNRKKGRKNQDSDEDDKKPKKKGFIRRHPKLTIFLFLLLCGGTALYLYGDQLVAKVTGGKSNLVDLVKTVVTEKITPLKSNKQGRTNIAIFGTSGYDMAGSEGKYVHDGAQLTDSLMVMSIDQKAKNAVTMSLPRDLKVGREACYTGKINEVYVCASNNGKNEEAGAQAVMKSLGEISGLEIHYYIHVNWGSLVQIVNALGGITVTVDEDINDYYYTKVVMKAGVPTHLDGEKALGLARARHGSASGDFTRGENQQKVLVAIKNRIAEKGMDIPAMINLVNVLGDNLKTNVNIDEIKTAAKVMSDFNPANIASVPLINTPEGNLVKNASFPVGGVDISFVIPSAGVQNYTKIQQFLESKIADYSDSPATSRILALNGTDEGGIAANEKIELEKAGFRVTGTGNAPKGEYPDKVSLYMIGSKEETKKKLETYYGLTAKPASELPKGIDTKNYDFVVIIGKPEIKE